MPVYPRVCGGTGIFGLPEAVVQGLSPRVRGNRSPVVQIAGNPGSIPACAGEPFRYVPEPKVREVYPRVCGGTHQSTHSLMQWMGLSPRVRGNPVCTVIKSMYARSIPACAGEP